MAIGQFDGRVGPIDKGLQMRGAHPATMIETVAALTAGPPA
jgi:hypothetical protein